MKIEGKDFLVCLDGKGNFREIVFQDKIFEPPASTLYEIDGVMAEVSQIPGEKELLLRLDTGKASGMLSISSGKEVRLRFESGAGVAVEKVGLVLPLPLGTEFHIPRNNNLGQKVDRDMPIYRQYSSNLGYNFLLADCEGMWIRFMVRQSRFGRAAVQISRYPEFFVTTLTWNAADDVFIAIFSSLDQAIEDYQLWLERELGIRKLKGKEGVPEWVHNVKLVLTLDMMRGNWEITHDYNDVINLAEELKEIGCPKDTLFYISGWNGAYDSTYPTYQPHPELGGKERFKEMVESLHKNGFRVMIHTNGWGLDPYHPDIDEYKKYVLRDVEGNYEGWCIFNEPPSEKGGWRLLEFRPDNIPFHGPIGIKRLDFETVHVPAMCEARLNIGGLKIGKARAKVTIGRRSHLTPPGWFEDHEEYEVPFPFRLCAGRNKIRVEVVGEADADWSECLLKIRYCVVPKSLYHTWTYPILRADMNNPEWIKIFVDNVESVVREHNIDAVHVDATGHFIPGSMKLLTALKERLPNVPIGGEVSGTLEYMDYWTFCMNARQTLIHYHSSENLGESLHLWDYSDMNGFRELHNWLDKPSPVNIFVKDYIRFYPHLCTADAFVPVGKVCNIGPPRLWPSNKEELWNVLRNSRILGYIPGLRVNYREYGLDEETKRAIKGISSW